MPDLKCFFMQIRHSSCLADSAIMVIMVPQRISRRVDALNPEDTINVEPGQACSQERPLAFAVYFGLSASLSLPEQAMNLLPEGYFVGFRVSGFGFRIKALELREIIVFFCIPNGSAFRRSGLEAGI